MDENQWTGTVAGKAITSLEQSGGAIDNRPGKSV